MHIFFTTGMFATYNVLPIFANWPDHLESKSVLIMISQKILFPQRLVIYNDWAEERKKMKRVKNISFENRVAGLYLIPRM